MEIDSGLNGHLGTMGKKKTAPMGVALAPELRAVGSLCGGVCAACGGVARWVGGALAYPTRRAALRFFGAGARALRGLGCRPMASAALGALWAFLYELTASPPAAP